MVIDVNELFDELGHLPQVEAIALGGSRATGRNDTKSDYDVYVYISTIFFQNTSSCVFVNIVCYIYIHIVVRFGIISSSCS